MSKRLNIPIHEGQNVILFGDDGRPLGEPTGSRQEQRTEMRRREKEKEKILKAHNEQKK
jgi:hypothetical protein